MGTTTKALPGTKIRTITGDESSFTGLALLSKTGNILFLYSSGNLSIWSPDAATLLYSSVLDKSICSFALSTSNMLLGDCFSQNLYIYDPYNSSSVLKTITTNSASPFLVTFLNNDTYDMYK